MNKKILIIEDDNKIVNLISLYLKKEGFGVSVSLDGKDGIEKAEKENPDLIILDLMLPKMNGFSVAKSIRSKSNVPILILTAKDDEVDRITGLELGADDYVIKPFSPKELIARIKAVLRRFNPEGQPKNRKIIAISDLQIIPDRFEVRKNETPVCLSLKEFNLLLVLAQDPGRVFPRSELLRQIYALDEKIVFDRTIDVHIANLRRKLNDKNQELIATVSGVGYKLND
jgi:DNA-binding response OmpR family regulator